MANSQQLLSMLNRQIASFYNSRGPEFKELGTLHTGIANVYDTLNMTFTAAQNPPETIGTYGAHGRKYGEAQGTASVWVGSKNASGTNTPSTATPNEYDPFKNAKKAEDSPAKHGLKQKNAANSSVYGSSPAKPAAKYDPFQSSTPKKNTPASNKNSAKKDTPGGPMSKSTKKVADGKFTAEDNEFDETEVSVLDLSAGIDPPETPSKPVEPEQIKYEETTSDQAETLERALNQASDDKNSRAKQ